MEQQQWVTDTPEQRVARGVALLDTREPGWRERITDELDMTDGERCVVGQVYRHMGFPWTDGTDALFGLDHDPWASHDHGFITDEYGDPYHMDRDATTALRDLWIKAINRE